MLKLKVSRNLGASYKDIEQFDDMLTATVFLESKKEELKKQRWVIEDEMGFLPLVCPLFDDIAEEVTNNHVSVSGDVYLRRYLNQRLIGGFVNQPS